MANGEQGNCRVPYLRLAVRTRCPPKAQRPGPAAGALRIDGSRISEPVEDLVGPEALEPVQRLVEPRELVAADAADLLHRAHVLLVELLDDVAHVDALLG